MVVSKSKKAEFHQKTKNYHPWLKQKERRVRLEPFFGVRGHLFWGIFGLDWILWDRTEQWTQQMLPYAHMTSYNSLWMPRNGFVPSFITICIKSRDISHARLMTNSQDSRHPPKMSPHRLCTRIPSLTLGPWSVTGIFTCAFVVSSLWGVGSFRFEHVTSQTVDIVELPMTQLLDSHEQCESGSPTNESAPIGR